MPYTYPSNDFQRPEFVRSLLGSVWTHIYDPGRSLIDDRVRARTEFEEQNHRNLLEAAAAVSRYTVPIYHTENWYAFYLLESQINNNDAALWRFDDVDLPAFDASPGFQFDVPLVTGEFTFELPTGVVDIPLISNRITDSSRVLTKNLDFRVDSTRNGIIFKQNPFSDELFATRDVFENGVRVDKELVLWLFRPQIDWDLVYQHFGYVLDLELPASEPYRDLVNCIMDGIAGGTALEQVECMVSMMTGIPLVRDRAETVTDIRKDALHLLVTTDQHVYKHNLTSTAVVAIGDELVAGTPLITGFEQLTPSSGQTSANLPALVMGGGMLSNDFRGELIFENTAVALSVTGAVGQERIEFSLGGHPLDVELFWDTVHARRLTYNTSLFDLMLAETAPLASTINPLEFLLANILRNNVVIFRVNAVDFTEFALGLGPSKLLRRITPPHITLLLVIELSPFSDSVTIDNVDDSQMGTFDAMEPLLETIAAANVDVSCFTIRNASFTCH